MPIKHQDFIIKGMHRDMTESAFNPEYAYENQNLRITTDPNAEGTRTGEMYAMTNERGNKYVPIYGLDSTGHNADGQYGDMNGVPIGQALLNNQWIVFMTDRDKQIFLNGTEKEIEDFPIENTNIVWLKTDNLDRIYRLWFNNDVMNGELLYEGHLNFSVSFPLETLPYFENSNIQKVYWTDGLNQPRMINIVEKPEKREHWNDYYFDFVSNIHFTHNVIIEESETGGRFPAGKIQWYFTYMMEFGPESNIFHSTPLYDIKFKDRGASPEEETNQSFKITLSNLDRQFDYVCIYSVIRTSLNNIPNCKLVAKIPITDRNIVFVDTNLTGEAVEPQSLFYKGGENISAYTFENKDNTLFLGNYTIRRSVIDKYVRNTIQDYAFGGHDSTGRYLKNDNTGRVKFNKSSYVRDIPYFKNGNIYRLGVQFQYYTGKWSEVIWIGDYTCNERAGWENYRFRVPGIKLTIDNQLSSTLDKLVSIGYRSIRPVIIYPDFDERTFVCQGVLCNTLRTNNNDSKYYPDYLFRIDSTGDIKKIYSKLCGYMHGKQALEHKSGTAYVYTHTDSINLSNEFFQSGRIANLYSPDAEFDDRLAFINLNNCKISLNHKITIQNSHSELEITTSSISKTKPGHYYDAHNGVKAIQTWNENWMNGTDTTFWEHVQIPDKPRVVPRGYGYQEQGVGYWYETKDDKYEFGTSRPKRLLYKNIDTQIGTSYHYVGGFIWEDTLQNLAMKHDETLQMNVPTKAAAFAANFIQFIYPVYMWQRTGSICYDNSDAPSSKLKTNRTLNYFESLYYDVNDHTEFQIMDARVVYNESLNVLVDKNDNDNKCRYSNWVNQIISFNKRSEVVPYGGYYMADSDIPPYSDLDTKQIKNHINKGTAFTSNIVSLWDEIVCLPYSRGEEPNLNAYFDWVDSHDSLVQGLDTADVKYKSVANIAIALGFDSSDMVTNDVGNTFDSLMPINNNGLRICDLTRTVETSSIFGGYTEEVLQRNSFIPCGDIIPIAEMYMEAMTDDPDAKLVEKYRVIDLTQHPITLRWDRGDVYFQEYECLKTYPYTLEDENCVTEVLDFDVETYVNINGRYDKNIKSPSMSTLPSNWNLMNPVYNQTNNFMEYHGLDLSKNSVDDFHNSFTWTLTKWAGDETDRWTQITLANTMDVDGVRGGITKIINYGDMLMAFQPRGLSQILYNEREQLVTGSGVPVELSNSGKVAGTRYISNLAGCNNKWSICKTEQALYFVDDVNKQIMAFNGQLNNLSDNLGFHSWINVKANESIWNPLVFSNFISHFDPYNEDVMFYYKDNALSYSEQLQCFDSFFSYGYVPYYMAFHNSAFTLSDRDSDHKDTYRVWEQHKGYHNYFYVHDRTVYENGEVKLKGRLDNEDKPTYFGYEPYWTTLMVNPDMPYDKIFTNVDMRTDMWDWEGKLMEETFSHIEVWNEFQYNKSLLTKFTDIPKLHMPAKHSILKKKMRVWYIDIPRDSSDVQSHIWRGLKQNLPERNGLLCNRWKNRDRMRNTWLYLKLSKELYDEGLVEKTQWYKMPFRTDSKQVIHHIGVSYFI